MLDLISTGCPKKRTFRILLEPQCSGSITSSRHPLCLEFGSFLTKTKPGQAFPSHIHGKISPIALNFGYDFVLLVHFLGHPVYVMVVKLSLILKLFQRR